MKGNPQKMAEKTLQSALEGLKRLKSSMDDLLDARSLIEARSGEIVVMGIGKSGAIAEKICATLTSLGQRAIYLHPVDAIHGDIGTLSKGDVIIALSFSGETKEVVKLVSYAKKEFHVPIISFTKSAKSSLGLLSEVVVKVPIQDEGSPAELAPMASTTAMLVLGDMLASMLSEHFKKDNFARFHPGGSIGLEVAKVKSLMKTGRALPKVLENDSVQSVLRVMSKKTLGVTAVVDNNGKLAGVITDGDIRRWLLKGGDLKGDKAKSLMTKGPKTTKAEASLKEALRIMEDHRITTLFVVSHRGVPEGIIHIHDIVEGNIV